MSATAPTTESATPGIAPSQTVGPFFLNCLLREDARRNTLVQPETAGERIRIEGRVLDGDGEPVPDALVEIWQADAAGRYHHRADNRADSHPADPAFIGFGRAGMDDNGAYWFETFETIRPGAVPFAADPADQSSRMQAPHISVMVFARGLLNSLATRLYFADDPANDADPLLALVPAARRETLLARRVSSDGRGAVYRFDIILQGAGETVFFNF
jgi:protocatechuate 3,4-dioxygenase, alpha subunit